ncbi:MAG: TRAM domain-containing protein [Thaumarchaeota archaeon]|nr:TRAM domain-containing protein [Nitrososphaerota archaeon]
MLDASVVQALGDERTSYGQGGGYGRPRFGGGGFRSNTPKPVEVGKEYDVTITETSRRGDGVAKIDGFVIFVAGGKRDEKTRIKVTQVGPRFANATKVEGTETTS